MNWPVEYRVLRTKSERPNHIAVNGRPLEEWSPEWIYRDWIAPGDSMGQWRHILATEADRALRTLLTGDGHFKEIWPDGVVDLFAQLVCVDGWVIEGRYAGTKEWQRLTPGFKDAGAVAELSDTRHRASDLWSQGYTQAQIAQRLGVADRTVRRWLNGK